MLAWIATTVRSQIGPFAQSIGHLLHRIFVRITDYVIHTLRQPFQRIDPTFLHQQSLELFEQSRRLTILRCIALAALLVTAVIFIIILIFRPPIWISPTRNVVAIAICIGTLRLSYTRLADAASYVLLGGVFAWILIFVAADPTGMSIRTVSLLSVVTLLILAARFLLTATRARVAIFAMSILAVGEAWFLPLKGPYPKNMVFPHQWVIGYLIIIYGLTVLLTWIGAKTTRDAMETYAAAYAHEYELEQQKDQFLRIASHELRAPLTPLLLSSRLLEQRLQRQEPDQAKLLFSAQEVSRHAKRMNGMIDLLLDINRVDQRRFLLEYETCDIAQIVRDVIETQQSHAHRSVVLTSAAAPVMLEGDPRRLWQVFSNLIVNAMKYTPEKTLIEVSIIAFHSSEDQTDWVQVMVRDEGPGIAAAELPHLFDRYYRVAEFAQGRIEGWGLGLFLCYEIVAAHAGTIGVASEPDKGTTFVITLPRSRPQELSV